MAQAPRYFKEVPDAVAAGVVSLFFSLDLVEINKPSGGTCRENQSLTYHTFPSTANICPSSSSSIIGNLPVAQNSLRSRPSTTLVPPSRTLGSNGGVQSLKIVRADSMQRDKRSIWEHRGPRRLPKACKLHIGPVMPQVKASKIMRWVLCPPIRQAVAATAASSFNFQSHYRSYNPFSLLAN